MCRPTICSNKCISAARLLSYYLLILSLPLCSLVAPIAARCCLRSLLFFGNPGSCLPETADAYIGTCTRAKFSPYYYGEIGIYLLTNVCVRTRVPPRVAHVASLLCPGRAGEGRSASKVDTTKTGRKSVHRSRFLAMKKPTPNQTQTKDWSKFCVAS